MVLLLVDALVPVASGTRSTSVREVPLFDSLDGDCVMCFKNGETNAFEELRPAVLFSFDVETYVTMNFTISTPALIHLSVYYLQPYLTYMVRLHVNQIIDEHLCHLKEGRYLMQSKLSNPVRAKKFDVMVRIRVCFGSRENGSDDYILYSTEFFR